MKDTTEIDPDSMFEIFLRLPLETLILLKTVCKSFRSLILSPLFRKLYFKQANSDNWRCAVISEEEPPSQRISLDTLNFNTSRRYVFQHECCFEGGSCYDPAILGACNGVLFIRVNEDLYLWNPVTSENRRITSQLLISEFPENGLSGLACNSVKDDYKAVICKPYDQGMEIYVYTSHNHYWKTLPNEIFTTNNSNQSASTVNGNPHWIVYRKDEQRNRFRVIIYFDSVTEKFSELLLPNRLWEYYNLRIGVIGGNLSLFYYKWTKYHVCVMSEYGVNDSWNNLIAMNNSYSSFKPLLFDTNTGEVLLEVNRRTLAIRNTKNEFRQMSFKDFNNELGFKVTNYAESLMFPTH